MNRVRRVDDGGWSVAVEDEGRDSPDGVVKKLFTLARSLSPFLFFSFGSLRFRNIQRSIAGQAGEANFLIVGGRKEGRKERRRAARDRRTKFLPSISPFAFFPTPCHAAVCLSVCTGRGCKSI